MSDRDEQQNIGAVLMAKQIRKTIEQGAGRFSDDDANWIVDAVTAAKDEAARTRREWEEDYLRHNAGHPDEVHPPELSCVVCRLEIRRAEGGFHEQG